MFYLNAYEQQSMFPSVKNLVVVCSRTGRDLPQIIRDEQSEIIFLPGLISNL